ncbi:MAG: GntR family transcriptional regulator [Bacteroidales bacterium]
MEFSPHKPIYLQIADSLCEKILGEEWKQEDRIPSVRELGVSLGVNPNTIVRVFEYMQNLNIIYNKRGIGYFVSEGAKKEILKVQRKLFITEELPIMIKRMKLLEISINEVESLYKTM